LIAGSGEGAFEQRLLDAGLPPENIFSCDIRPELFRVKEIKCLKCDFSGPLPYKTASFDIAVSIEVLEHLENPWYHLNELHRVLKSGGVLVLTVPNTQALFERLYYLLTGKFWQFAVGRGGRPTIFAPEGHGHLTPIFDWILEDFIKDKFYIIKRTYNRGWIPLLRLELPSEFLGKPLKILGESSIWKLKKR